MEQTSSMQIKKVKYSENAGKISVEFSKTADGHTAEYSGTFDEQAEPAFYSTLDKLLDPVLQILAFNPKEFEDRIHPYGVTYKYGKDGTMSAIISSKLDVNETQIAINTPIRSCKTENTEESASYFNEDTVKVLQTLQQLTENYLQGKRAQMSLFEGQNEQPDEERDEDPFRDDPKGNIVNIGKVTANNMQSPTQA
ncbi:hypothetical protein [Megasphaera sueciensis]|uniref:hypothetical protein n=1 Tax=Megasphaera sueciensis TaxID=349094 RepID=UPI003D048968